MELCDTNKCTGCRACMNACPKEAISMGHDKLLKTIPVIDNTKCVNCGMCKKACPVLNESKYSKADVCLAAWTCDKEDQKTCSSGGVATALSKLVFQNGGKVFGCDFDKDFNLTIRPAESLDDIERFKKSKYVQSSTGDSYKKVKEYLEQDLEVLYIATPCQIDGLLHFLKKDYEKLYTIDIICHGVPPIEYLKQYITFLKKSYRINKIDDISFRGENEFYFSASSNNEKVYYEKSYFDLYYESFLRSVSYRDNCYSCRYAKIDRVSDLTIGDYWGLDKSSLHKPYQGRVSEILVNTAKGKALLDKAGDYLYTEQASLKVAIDHNEQLSHPSDFPGDRNVFVEAFKGDFIKASYKTAIGKRIKKVIMKKRLKRLLKGFKSSK